jgi:hypothetical protein
VNHRFRHRADVQHTDKTATGQQRHAQQRPDAVHPQDGVHDVGIGDVVDQDRSAAGGDAPREAASDRDPGPLVELFLNAPRRGGDEVTSRLVEEQSGGKLGRVGPAACWLAPRRSGRDHSRARSVLTDESPSRRCGRAPHWLPSAELMGLGVVAVQARRWEQWWEQRSRSGLCAVKLVTSEEFELAVGVVAQARLVAAECGRSAGVGILPHADDVAPRSRRPDSFGGGLVPRR